MRRRMAALWDLARRDYGIAPGATPMEAEAKAPCATQGMPVVDECRAATADAAATPCRRRHGASCLTRPATPAIRPRSLETREAQYGAAGTAAP
jgi:hypothetical protein